MIRQQKDGPIGFTMDATIYTREDSMLDGSRDMKGKAGGGVSLPGQGVVS